MKRNFFALVLVAAIGFSACNNTGEGDTGSDTTTGNMDGMADTANTSTMNNAPLDAADVDFVMTAAEGGVMEVESGNIAQQNAGNERVKAFGSMMVRDHTNANNELKTLASSRGVMISEDSIKMKHKDHFEAMQKMKGKEFDGHYMNMMVNDHKKTLDEFERASNNVKDADLKAWAAKTIPVLRMHYDSAQAIHKVIK